MFALTPHREDTRDPVVFDHDRVVWDPDYRREVIEQLKHSDAEQRRAAEHAYN